MKKQLFTALLCAGAVLSNTDVKAFGPNSITKNNPSIYTLLPASAVLTALHGYRHDITPIMKQDLKIISDALTEIIEQDGGFATIGKVISKTVKTPVQLAYNTVINKHFVKAALKEGVAASLLCATFLYAAYSRDNQNKKTK